MADDLERESSESVVSFKLDDSDLGDGVDLEALIGLLGVGCDDLLGVCLRFAGIGHEGWTLELDCSILILAARRTAQRP